MTTTNQIAFTHEGIMQVMNRLVVKLGRSTDTIVKSDRLMQRDGVYLCLSCKKKGDDELTFTIDMDLREYESVYEIGSFPGSLFNLYLHKFDDMAEECGCFVEEEVYSISIKSPTTDDVSEQTKAAMMIADKLNEVVFLKKCTTCETATMNPEPFCHGCIARGALDKKANENVKGNVEC